jgi:uncharacterized protein with GYD domain
MKGKVKMSTYLMFGKYSMEGVKSVSAKRTDRAMALLKQNGGELQSAYVLLGDIDLVIIVNFPNMQSAMKASLALSKLLSVSFSTLPALSVTEFDNLLE